MADEKITTSNNVLQPSSADSLASPKIVRSSELANTRSPSVQNTYCKQDNQADIQDSIAVLDKVLSNKKEFTQKVSAYVKGNNLGSWDNNASWEQKTVATQALGLLKQYAENINNTKWIAINEEKIFAASAIVKYLDSSKGEQTALEKEATSSYLKHAHSGDLGINLVKIITGNNVELPTKSKPLIQSITSNPLEPVTQKASVRTYLPGDTKNGEINATIQPITAKSNTAPTLQPGKLAGVAVRPGVLAAAEIERGVGVPAVTKFSPTELIAKVTGPATSVSSASDTVVARSSGSNIESSVSISEIVLSLPPYDVSHSRIATSITELSTTSEVIDVGTTNKTPGKPKEVLAIPFKPEPGLNSHFYKDPTILGLKINALEEAISTEFKGIDINIILKRITNLSPGTSDSKSFYKDSKQIYVAKKTVDEDNPGKGPIVFVGLKDSYEYIWTQKFGILTSKQYAEKIKPAAKTQLVTVKTNIPSTLLVDKGNGFIQLYPEGTRAQAKIDPDSFKSVGFAHTGDKAKMYRDLISAFGSVASNLNKYQLNNSVIMKQGDSVFELEKRALTPREKLSYGRVKGMDVSKSFIIEGKIIKYKNTSINSSQEIITQFPID